MSRLLLNSSILRSTAASNAASSTAIVAATGGAKQSKVPSHVVRRWKSFIHHNQKHFRTTAALSSLEAANTRGLPGSGSINALARPITTAATMANSARTATASSDLDKRCLQLENINPYFITMEYAVRGPLVIRAVEIEKELQKGVKKPFDQVIRANIGDAHAMGQRPITFIRQLLALTYEPRLLDSPDYPEDVKQRARAILDGCAGGSVGSYTDSKGLEVVRRQVAAFIEQRDGFPCDYNNLFLTGGASPGIKSILQLMRCEKDGKLPGIMVPIPQYPLYSATIAEYGMEKIDYYLDEDANWGLDPAELQRAYDESKKTCNPRALVVINPGNPTGQVLTRQNIEDVIKFAYKNKLLIMADEVYQANIYDKQSKFHSFKKVVNEMGAPYKDMELTSFMSVSKGYTGECGIRGGYMEVCNMCPQVFAMLTKSLTASLCSTSAGQIAISAVANPPQPGEPSYELYKRERDEVLNSLNTRAQMVYDAFSSFEGFKVNPVQGAMYVFPQVAIPPKALAAAKAKNMPADTFYAFELLESTGICVVSGSGFGQRPGTYHFRTTILPQPDKLKLMLDKFNKFHAEFNRKYK